MQPVADQLLTGLGPSTTGVYAPRALVPHLPAAQGPRDAAAVLRRARLPTLTAGKIFHDAYPAEADRRRQEFDVWGRAGGSSRGRTEVRRDAGPASRSMDWGVVPGAGRGPGRLEVADWAVEQLKKPPKGSRSSWPSGFRLPARPVLRARKSGSTSTPRTSCVLPPVKDDDRDDLPRFAWYLHWKLPEPRLTWLKEHNQWKPLVRAYLASISFVDSQVGRVLDALDGRRPGRRTRSSSSGATTAGTWARRGSPARTRSGSARRACR